MSKAKEKSKKDIALGNLFVTIGHMSLPIAAIAKVSSHGNSCYIHLVKGYEYLTENETSPGIQIIGYDGDSVVDQINKTIVNALKKINK